MVRIERADAALLSGDVAGKVRGVAGMTVINAAFIDALPKLEIIANMGVGYDGSDPARLRRSVACPVCRSCVSRL